LLLSHQDLTGCPSFQEMDPKKMNRRWLPSFGLAWIAMIGLGLALLGCGNASGSDENVTAGAQALTSDEIFLTCASTCARDDLSSCGNSDACFWPGTCASTLCEGFAASACPITSTILEGGVFGPFCQLIGGVCQPVEPCPTGEISETMCEEGPAPACRWTPVGPCVPIAPCPTGNVATIAECTSAGPTCQPTVHLAGGNPCPRCAI
jgi:hypothetical protein